MKRPAAVIAAFSTSFASTFGSSIAIGAQDAITTKFHVAASQGILLVSLYLIGCSIGPFLYAPFGEALGRKYPLGAGVTLMVIFAAASAVAPNWSSLLAFRFLGGFGAAGPLAVCTSIVADIFPKPDIRSYLVCCSAAITTLGFLLSSVVSLQIMSRWPNSWPICFWVNMAVSGVSWLTIFAMPETNPVTSGLSIAYRHYSPKDSLGKILLPFRMAFLEPIVLVICLFLSLQYSIFYLFFQLLPRIFTEAGYVDTKGPGLLFAPFATGTALACLGYIILDFTLTTTATKEPRKPVPSELYRLPPVCIGSALIILSLFLTGYCISIKSKLIYILILEGAFGLGFLLIFVSLINYLVDAYKVLAASALASSFFVRNIMGATLPFVTEPIHRNLGAEWSFYVLGIASTPLACIIFGFLFYGPWLRLHSPLCQAMSDKRESTKDTKF